MNTEDDEIILLPSPVKPAASNAHATIPRGRSSQELFRPPQALERRKTSAGSGGGRGKYKFFAPAEVDAEIQAKRRVPQREFLTAGLEIEALFGGSSSSGRTGGPSRGSRLNSTSLYNPYARPGALPPTISLAKEHIEPDKIGVRPKGRTRTQYHPHVEPMLELGERRGVGAAGEAISSRPEIPNQRRNAAAAPTSAEQITSAKQHLLSAQRAVETLSSLAEASDAHAVQAAKWAEEKARLIAERDGLKGEVGVLRRENEELVQKNKGLVNERDRVVKECEGVKGELGRVREGMKGLLG